MNKNKSLWSLIVARAAHSPMQCFVRDEDGRTLTFAEYLEAALRVAAGLQAMGIGAHSTVAWQLPTWQEALVLTAALARLGARQVPMLPMLREQSVGFICAQVKADLLVVPKRWKDFDHGAMAASIANKQTSLRILAIEKGELPVGDAASLAPVPVAIETDPVRWVFYTSGTTGDPKGALHGDGAIIATAFGMVGVLELRVDDVVPLVFPFTHIGGFVWLVSHLLVGCQCLLIETFSAAIVHYLGEHKVTVAGAGATFAQTYLKAQRESSSKRVMPDLRCVTGGGSTRPAQLHEEVKTELQCAGFISGYGLTECPIAVMNTVRDPGDKLTHTEGRALPGMLIKIIGADGRRVPAGVQGVIWLNGPHRCRGYVDATLDATSFDAQGYLNSGDIGMLDEDGWLTVTGRLKDIIIRKGENISAKKVEDALYQHPLIADVAVIGLADVERGELACAVIELRTAGAAPSLEEIKEFGRGKGLALFETPERVEVVEKILRNPSGKVLKDALRQQLMQKQPS